MSKKLHIISLDIPYPPDYGGMIDVFYKLKALSESGVEVTLHCFQYGNRKPAEELKKYCKSVYYYPRLTGIKGVHFSLPYIISSRNDRALLDNLLKDEDPILFEGLHSTYWINHPALQQRVKLLRAHNIESDYYRQLAQNTRSIAKKVYYFFEANRLLINENSLKEVSQILAISEADKNFFEKKYPLIPVMYVPAFHANERVSSKIGKGTYCLYHGNLSVPENIKSVRFLVKEVFDDLDVPLIIAGKQPSAEIQSFASNKIKIIANPTEAEMQELIQQAHTHVLPSFQDTGMKLKLLNALFAGRFVIMNKSNLDALLLDAVHMAENVTEFKAKILAQMQLEFTEEDFKNRQLKMGAYQNSSSAELIIKLF